jgi:hypothetical protein
MPAETVLAVMRMPVVVSPLPPAVIVPLLSTPPRIVLRPTKIASVAPTLGTCIPGVIAPALVTAPVTVELVIRIEVMDCPAAFVTVATVWPLTFCPAPGAATAAGNAKRSAATEVVAKRKEAGKRDAARGRAAKERIGKVNPRFQADLDFVPAWLNQTDHGCS